MKVIVFAGPSRPFATRMDGYDLCMHGPAMAGDVYTAAAARPAAIAIIDGYFEAVPAIRHKEILSALAQGIAVFGSSSMGALRAVELAPYGMRGIGRIYASFAEQEIADDDEVAILHGPAGSGYLPLTDAMVNIRATLRMAVASRVISSLCHDAAIEVAKSMFYKERTYGEVLCRMGREKRWDSELSALGRWLPDNKVDQKRLDADHMLQTIARLSTAELQPGPILYELQHSRAWQGLERRYRRRRRRFAMEAAKA